MHVRLPANHIFQCTWFDVPGFDKFPAKWRCFVGGQRYPPWLEHCHWLVWWIQIPFGEKTTWLFPLLSLTFDTFFVFWESRYLIQRTRTTRKTRTERELERTTDCFHYFCLIFAGSLQRNFLVQKLRRFQNFNQLVPYRLRTIKRANNCSSLSIVTLDDWK